MPSWALVSMAIACLAPSMKPSGASALACTMRGAHGLDAEPHGREQHGVDAHAHGRLLGAGGRHLGDALHLREPLHDHGVGHVVELVRRQGLGGERQDQDRRGGRVRLPEARQRGHVGRQVDGGGVDRRLHVLGGAHDAARGVELDGDARGAQRVDRGQLAHPRDLAQAPLQRCRHARGHGLGIAAGQGRRHADGGELDRRQARHRQAEVGHDADEEEADGEQRGADRPLDEGPREVHGPTPPASGSRPRSRNRAPSAPGARAAAPWRGRSRAWCRA